MSDSRSENSRTVQLHSQRNTRHICNTPHGSRPEFFKTGYCIRLPAAFTKDTDIAPSLADALYRALRELLLEDVLATVDGASTSSSSISYSNSYLPAAINGALGCHNSATVNSKFKYL